MWDEQAERWSAYASEEHRDPFFWFINRSVISDLLPERRECVLDLGCGEGRAGYACVEGHSLLTSIDLSHEMLTVGRRTAPAPRSFVRADIQRLPVLSATVDVALSIMVLMSLENPVVAVNEMYRVLKPGGCAIFCIVHPIVTSSRGSPINGSVEAVDYGVSRRNHDRHVVRGEQVLLFRHWHRPVSYYLNSTIGLGFTVDRVREPIYRYAVPAERLERWSTTPHSLIWRAWKAA